jgi:hypothetical protein
LWNQIKSNNARPDANNALPKRGVDRLEAHQDTNIIKKETKPMETYKEAKTSVGASNTRRMGVLGRMPPSASNMVCGF